MIEQLNKSMDEAELIKTLKHPNIITFNMKLHFLLEIGAFNTI